MAARILIVDDDPKLSGLFRTFLEKVGGYEVREENRPFFALATAREFLPSLIMLDVNMPGKDGGDVAAEISADATLGSVPILFCTSLIARRETSKSSVQRGGRHFLSKPVDPHVLLNTVRLLLDQAEAA